MWHYASGISDRKYGNCPQAYCAQGFGEAGGLLAGTVDVVYVGALPLVTFDLSHANP